MDRIPAIHTTETGNEIPVFKLNFYLMGQEDVDNKITVQIGSNIDYINQEFEGVIKFELGRLFMDPNAAYIPDLHKEHVQKNTRNLHQLIDPIEVVGSINIYLFDTYSENDGLSAMMGFTPVLSRQHRTYQSLSPNFDRLFIAYPGLIDKSTIVHELGHFFGLSHPWEMNSASIDMMGLNNKESEKNHMNYHPEVNHFTEEQLDRMNHFALTFRRYLTKEIQIEF